jgi:hypothetical protein
MSAALWLGLGNHAHAANDCSVVLQFSESLFTGSYNLVNGEDAVYRAGRNFSGSSESRNWFACEMPSFDAPLVAAELRVNAGLVWPTNVTVAYELHHVTTSFEDLAYHTGNRTNTFNDLGDGPVLGGRTISTQDGWWRGKKSALLGIPLNAAALAEITAKQNSWFCLGGVVTSTTPFTAGWVFDNDFGFPVPQTIQLVLYFSDSGQPKVSAINYDPPLTLLTDERINLSAVACGKEPLHRQWLRNGAPIQTLPTKSWSSGS